MQLQIETLSTAKHFAAGEKIAIRMATNAEGEAIYTLVQQAGFKVTGLDWSKVAPYWLLALVDGEIAGCVQVCISRPIGRIEMLAIHNKYTNVTRGRLVEKLVMTAASTLKAAGAQMVAGLIPFEMKSYKRVLRRRGCIALGAGNEMGRKL